MEGKLCHFHFKLPKWRVSCHQYPSVPEWVDTLHFAWISWPNSIDLKRIPFKWVNVCGANIAPFNGHISSPWSKLRFSKTRNWLNYSSALHLMARMKYSYPGTSDVEYPSFERGLAFTGLQCYHWACIVLAQAAIVHCIWCRWWRMANWLRRWSQRKCKCTSQIVSGKWYKWLLASSGRFICKRNCTRSGSTSTNWN